MRLFTAIDLAPELLLRLERLQSSLRPEAFIKWSPLDNFHITTKFIGEWPDSRLDELFASLETLPPREPFDVELKDLGWFPDARSPRVLWVGVHGDGPLENLARATDECLTKIGIAKEERPFTPHLTLARIKHPVPLDKLRERVSGMQSVSLGAFTATRFALFRSDPGSNSSVYRKLRIYPFQSAVASS